MVGDDGSSLEPDFSKVFDCNPVIRKDTDAMKAKTDHAWPDFPFDDESAVSACFCLVKQYGEMNCLFERQMT